MIPFPIFFPVSYSNQPCHAPKGQVCLSDALGSMIGPGIDIAVNILVAVLLAGLLCLLARRVAKIYVRRFLR